MARKDAIPPEVPVEEADTPTGDVTLESGAEGADLASEATSPTFDAAPEETGAAEAASDAEEAAEAIGPEGEGPETEAEIVGEAAAPTKAPAAAGKARPYRPGEDYAEGDRIFHPVWDAVGVVTYRDPQERIFRIPIGRVEERGRCHMIRVEFDKEVPAAGGPRREVTLIADWHGRTFEVGQPPEREAEAILSFRPTEEERPRPKGPALPEIPEPEEMELEEEDVEDEEESTDEDVQPLGI